MNRDQRIEEMNYQGDYRTRANANGSAWEGYRQKARTLSIEVYIDDEQLCDVTFNVDFPAVLEVCDTCKGEGSYVNPSIDASGISCEDFDEDPEFEESYREGHYDQICATCEGKRVIPVVDEEALPCREGVDIKGLDDCDEEHSVHYTLVQLWKLHQELVADRYAFEAESRAERMMGA